jgi:hypothetical protein
MKRWRYLSAVFVVIALCAGGGRYVWEKHAENAAYLSSAREATYRSALRSYSNNLKPGTPRRDVENYLRAKGAPITQMGGRSGRSDLTKIGKEDAPWYCSEYNVYVMFKFDATDPATGVLSDSDKLKEVTIFRWLEGCL